MTERFESPGLGAHGRPEQRAGPVRVLERHVGVEVLAPVHVAVQRDPVGVVRHLHARGEEAVEALLQRLPREHAPAVVAARDEVRERRQPRAQPERLLVRAVEPVVGPARLLVALVLPLEPAVERVQEAVVGFAAQDPGRLLLVVVARPGDVEVVVGRPVVAGVPEELPGAVVESEFELREQESGVPSRLDGEHVERQREDRDVAQVEHHRLRDQLVLEVDLHPA